jgi:hypothetical protein
MTDAAKNYLLNIPYLLNLQNHLPLELGTAPFNPFIIANKERKKKFIYLIQNLQL